MLNCAYLAGKEHFTPKDRSVTKLESRQMHFACRGKLYSVEIKSGDLITCDKPGVRLPNSTAGDFAVDEILSIRRKAKYSDILLFSLLPYDRVSTFWRW